MLIGVSGLVSAQTADPFVRPPPTQAPSPGQAPSPDQTPPNSTQPAMPVLTMDLLARQGFEVKAMERVSDRAANFTVLMQRGPEIRACLMRVIRDQNRNPRRESVCF